METKHKYTEQEMQGYVASTARETYWKDKKLKEMDKEYLNNALKMIIRNSDNGSKKMIYYSRDASAWIIYMQMELQYRDVCELMIANGLSSEEDLDIPKISMKIFLDKDKI